MEPEVSLPCSQQSAIGSCPEADESSPHFSKIQSNIIILSTPRSFEWSYPLRFSDQKLRMYFSSHPCVLYVPPS